MWTVPIRRARRGLWAVIAVLAVAHAALTVPELPLGDTFDLDAENGPGTWFATMSLAATALGFAVLAGAARRSNRRWRPLAVAALVALALSAEEVVGLHERASTGVGEQFGTSGNVESGTPIVGLLALPFAVGGLALLARCLSSARGRRVAFGTAVWYTAVFGVEELESWNANRGAEEEERIRVDRTFTGVQEALEMAGVIVVLLSLLEEIAGRAVAIELTFAGDRPPEDAE